MELETLFSPRKIGNVKIKNRIVRSATYEKRATKYGQVSEDLINLYTDLAKGGTGLIITGAIAVDHRATGSQNQAYLYDESFIAGQRKLVKAVHEYSDVKIAAQIHHSGRQGDHPKYETVAPSPIPHELTKRVPRKLTDNEIKEIIDKFVDAGRRAFESEYDMVQLHGAHGYLLSNFISRYTNKREDEYGGNILNQTKILVDIFKQLRGEVGKNFPITIKLQTQDCIPGGLTLEEAKEIIKILVDTGYDAIEPSGGLIETMKDFTSKNILPSKVIKSSADENYFLPTAKELKPLMRETKLILMGGIRNPLSAEKFLKKGIADFISLSRPLIYEPDLPNRWKNGDLSPPLCVSCNSCYMTMLKGTVYCVVKKRLETKK